MKIGIMTFWWSEDNYGQQLQCYALQEHLRDLGHEPFLIRYLSTNDYKPTPLFIKILKAFNPKKLYNYLQFLFKKNAAANEQEMYPRFFSDFRDKYLIQSFEIYYSYKELKENPPCADVYIVGSDQVWNFGNLNVSKVKNLIDAYFLNFGSEKTKRLSYAASWGQVSISQEYIKIIKPLLEKFDYVSVREKTGVELCKNCDVDAEWVPDPTMLLMADKYRDIYNENNFEKPKKVFILLYLLGNECDFSIKKFYDWAKNKDLEVIYVTGNNNIDKYQKTFVTIPQWLYLVDNAEYVVTNSYHCCVFSAIFNKQFAAVPVKGNIKGMNSRLDSLWELLHIEPRVINSNDFSILDIKYKCNRISISNGFLNALGE